MSGFPKVLADRVEGYIALRRSLGYAFRSSAAILRKLARYVAAKDLDGPLTQDLALRFVLSWKERLTVVQFDMALSAVFATISLSTTRGPKCSILVHFPGRAPFHHRES